MTKYIIEQDNLMTATFYYAVEADSLEKAINKVFDMDHFAMETYPEGEVSYKDSHKATEAEWGEVNK